MDCDEKDYHSVAVTPAPVQVPTLRPLVLSVTSVVGYAEKFSPLPRRCMRMAVFLTAACLEALWWARWTGDLPTRHYLLAGATSRISSCFRRHCSRAGQCLQDTDSSITSLIWLELTYCFTFIFHRHPILHMYVSFLWPGDRSNFNTHKTWW